MISWPSFIVVNVGNYTQAVEVEECNPNRYLHNIITNLSSSSIHHAENKSSFMSELSKSILYFYTVFCSPWMVTARYFKKINGAVL
jgi:hypothetical protein